MYIYETKIQMHHTDAAGVLFFGDQFKMIHDAYQAMFESAGVRFADMFREKEYYLPIVHAESDFKRPLYVGDKILIEVETENTGSTSFTLIYKLLNENGDTVGTAKTVHVSVDAKTKEKTPLPEKIKKIL